RRYLIEIYTAAGAPDKALAVARAGDLGMASYVESFRAAKGTAKSINLYDLALLTDLTRLYRELARRQLEQAAADARMKPSAEYYLAEVLNDLGSRDEASTYVEAFLARAQTPVQYRERARVRQALIAHRQGRRAEAESAWTAMAESGSDPEVLADIVLGCADAQAQCSKVLARVGQVTEAGDGRRYQRLNFALGSYYLRKKDYARAISYMEAGRDKSNKNKIEANDPEMLAGLAEAYYRTKKFSEGLEIFFEMSKEFPVVRQIQEAMQGVYSMEQRSAELVFNGLVGIDEKQEIVPELAERWEASKDGRVFTFFLRKDVKWHPREGEAPRPFTADDVVFTYNIMMHPKTITPLKVRYEFIEKVEKTGDYTVVITLKRPILNALAKFSFKIIPKHGPANPQYLTREDRFAHSPIGTGPYMLQTVTGDGEVVLVANPDYFKGRAHIDKFIARPFADQNIMAQALMFNAIDMIVLVNPRNLPEV